MAVGHVFILGGTGFVGAETVREAVQQGVSVTALARSEEAAERLRALGAVAVRGDAADPAGWIDAARGADVLVDLVQPELPRRIGRREIERVAQARRATTRALLAALAGLPEAGRPLLVSVSGTDDLAPDAEGRIAEDAPLRVAPVGFGHVGVPVRRAIEASGLAATFVHLGTVYGPGKSFADTVFPRLARGRLRLPGDGRNQLPLVHVRDAARALVHLAGLGRARLTGRTWVVVDEAGGASLAAFFDTAAERMGVPAPGRVPGWIARPLLGAILLETMTRDLQARPAALLASGFQFTYPTVDEGLPATLAALGWGTRPPPAARRGGTATAWWALLIVTAGALLAVNVLHQPPVVAELTRLLGDEPLLDMRPAGYAPADAGRVLAGLGAEGRRLYLELLGTVDVALPILFSAFLWLSLALGSLRRWAWLGVLGGAVDALENVAEAWLLLAWPDAPAGVARLASALTVGKFALYLGALGLAAAGAVVPRVRRRRERLRDGGPPPGAPGPERPAACYPRPGGSPCAGGSPSCS